MADETMVLLTVGQEAFQIWILILLGYVARRSEFISADASIGIGQIAGRVALPALIFRLVATADLGSVDWRIVGGMQLCQVVASTGAGLMAIAVGGAFPVPRISLAGAFALFVANVDYTAVGVPLIRSLFPESYLLYLYMFLLINVCVIVPCTFLVMEVGSRQGDISGKKCGMLLLLKESMFRVVTNPIVVAGVLGMAWNLSTHGAKIVGIADDVLVSLGSAFRTCALFNLGMGIVGHVHEVTVRGSIVPVALSLWKSLALPVLARSLVTNLVGDFEGKFVFVCGIVGSAASTPLMISMFLPKLVDTMRLSTIINLVLSMPLFIISAIVYSSSWEHTKAFLDWFRWVSDDASMVALVIVIAGFAVVPRWRRYPMLFTLDLAVLDLPFHVAHFFCTAKRGYPTTYIITNIFRLAWLGYLLGLTMIMGAIGRWQEWYPEIPLGYPDVAKVGGGATQQLKCAFHSKMRRMHWIVRLASLAFGTVFTLIFVRTNEEKYIGCWVEYGDWQWKTEFVINAVFFLVEFVLVIAYWRGGKRGEGKQFRGITARIVILIWCGLGHLLISAILVFTYQLSPDRVLKFDEELLLILDLFLRGGGGVLLLLVLEGVYGIGPSVKVRVLQMKQCVVGANRPDELRLLAARIASDPSIEIFSVKGLPQETPMDLSVSARARAGSAATVSAISMRTARSDTQRLVRAGTASIARRTTVAFPSVALDTNAGHEITLDKGWGFKLAAVEQWLKESGGCGSQHAVDQILEELMLVGLLKKAALIRPDWGSGVIDPDEEEFCRFDFTARMQIDDVTILEDGASGQSDEDKDASESNDEESSDYAESRD